MKTIVDKLDLLKKTAIIQWFKRRFTIISNWINRKKHLMLEYHRILSILLEEKKYKIGEMGKTNLLNNQKLWHKQKTQTLLT